MEANLNTDINPSVQEESGNETVVNTEILRTETAPSFRRGRYCAANM